MIKKISLVAVLAAFSLTLVGCGDSGSSSSTGVKECDEYIATMTKYVEKESNEEDKAQYNEAIKNMKDAIANTKGAKDAFAQQCKAANDAIKSVQ